MPGDQVDYVIMGQVLQAGAGQIPSRQAAVAAGIPMTVPVADHQQGLPVRAGRDRAGRPAHPGRRVRHRGGRRHGVDDPGAAPAARRPARLQVRLGRAGRLDGPRRPHRRLRPRVHGRVDRAAQRRARHHAARSRTSSPPGRTSARPRAIKDGLFDEPRSSRVPVPQRRGEPVMFDTDEGDPRRHHRRVAGRAAARLRRATARSPPGSASQISDGACAVVVMSAEAAAAAGATGAGRDRRARRGGRARTTRCTPSRRGAIERALGKAGLAVADLDLIEINEAFAAVAIQSMRDLGRRPGPGQRQRRRHRARPPDRRVRRPDRAAPDLRAAPPGRRPRRRGAVRRRRPGRRAAAAGARPRRG